MIDWGCKNFIYLTTFLADRSSEYHLSPTASRLRNAALASQIGNNHGENKLHFDDT